MILVAYFVLLSLPVNIRFRTCFRLYLNYES